MHADGFAFASFLERCLPTIEAGIRDRLPRTYTMDESDDLDTYLYGPLERFVFAGGKRIRPALCILGAEAVGASGSVALSPAYAVEIFQAAALIHDDIADKSELRRGEPCLHKAEGTGIAINVGDVAVVDVAASVMQDATLSPSLRLRLFDELYAMERLTLEGQALDLGWARDGRWDLSEDDYLTMARLKTAHYSCAIPLAMGALCGEGTDEQVEGLRSFGLSCGLAFQIQDDLLNLVGDAEAQGKDYRSDVTEGKRTLVMVRALSQLNREDSHELETILSSHTTDAKQLDRAVALAQKSGAIDYAREYAQSLIRTAKDELSSVSCTSTACETLFSMADFFVSRAS